MRPTNTPATSHESADLLEPPLTRGRQPRNLGQNPRCRSGKAHDRVNEEGKSKGIASAGSNSYRVVACSRDRGRGHRNLGEIGEREIERKRNRRYPCLFCRRVVAVLGLDSKCPIPNPSRRGGWGTLTPGTQASRLYISVSQSLPQPWYSTVKQLSNYTRFMYIIIILFFYVVYYVKSNDHHGMRWSMSHVKRLKYPPYC